MKLGQGVSESSFWFSRHASEEEGQYPLFPESSAAIERICKRWKDLQLNDGEKEVGAI